MQVGGVHPEPQTVDLIRSGLFRAEQGLSELIGSPVRIEVDMITLEPALNLDRMAGDPEAGVAGVYVGFEGDLAGHCLLCLSAASARHLVTTLLGVDDDPQMADSVLLEVGNIVVSGVVNGLADRGGWEIRVSTPSLGRDMLGALLNTVLTVASMTVAELLAVRARFRSAEQEIAGTLVLLPDARSLRLLAGMGRVST